MLSFPIFLMATYPNIVMLEHWVENRADAQTFSKLTEERPM